MADETGISTEVVKAPHKDGYKTSEFWLTLFTVIVGTMISSGAVGSTSGLGKALAFCASALAALGYSYSRGLVKKA